jgi:hypothetical protein
VRSFFSPFRNRLLASQSADDLGLLQPHLESVILELRMDLKKPDKRIDHAYFVDTGIASVVAIQSNETRAEVGLIGCEGMSGIAIRMLAAALRLASTAPAAGV